MGIPGEKKELTFVSSSCGHVHTSNEIDGKPCPLRDR